jgi:hypothetical protein
MMKSAVTEGKACASSYKNNSDCLLEMADKFRRYPPGLTPSATLWGGYDATK